MTTQVSGDSGVSQCQPNSVSQEDLAANVVGKGPAFAAKRTAVQIVTSATDTTVIYPTEEFDIGSLYDNTTGRFQPNLAGYYQINASSRLSGDGTVTRCSLNLIKNGTVNLGTSVFTNGAFPHSLGVLVFLNGSTDYVSAVVNITSGSPVYVDASNTNPAAFSAVLVRAA